ncbi:arylesterase [Pelagicoccus sp. SDUM812002]|uniref:arylesterase n=1 Tax=Pelagicoccus sp. SDUM812002 TaxID=3041266 RepID=UPI00280EC20A|nr:arylesterase [Pelagicoccus sp. SDUM812002]MDQ8187540.1 arylesterase [Pelagicoccus sp. SDUM812002]
MKPTRLTGHLIAIYTLLSLTNLAFSATDEKRILFLGDSLTAGYGIDPNQAYPALLAEKLEERGLEYAVSPAGLSGETSAGGLRRAKWVMQKPVDILVLALGANDGLRGIKLSDTKRNLQGIIDFAKGEYPNIKIVIAGMLMPPNLGEAYTAEFRAMFPSLAETNDATLIPFLLEGVAGEPELNIADGIHPNPEGHKILAETVWNALEPLLEK